MKISHYVPYAEIWINSSIRMLTKTSTAFPCLMNMGIQEFCKR
jgi:hypothetical protein